ncbi:IS66 family insertion sequence element accessory protein TnpB [Antarcticimicrobium luteum]|uniref:Transposase n=1 Tax=Antarcticimicrobium luteum TaxID=2547397 RepID=A0A4R5VDT1_9RHOB|nr:IS66 family insertion sequence element accessory protein TnpB [Antarcticimicrobium luteum]TDK50407.1 hypothetical protein E1832_06230 [Antarcticimicrobium luteum]
MISPAGGLRVYVATRPTDFRKGIDGLALLVQETMGLDPFSGAAFVFRTSHNFCSWSLPRRAGWKPIHNFRQHGEGRNYLVTPVKLV